MEKKLKEEDAGEEKTEDWKNHMEEIMSKENDWDHVTAASMAEVPIKNVTREEMAIAIKVIKPGKAAGPFEVCAEMISACGEIGVSVMVELCQRELDAKGMPDEWNGKQLCWYQFWEKEM